MSFISLCVRRLALEELSRGAKRAKERSQTMGSLGWKNSPIPSANKRYLQNTLRSTIQTNKRLDEKSSKKEKAHSSKRERADCDWSREKSRDDQRRDDFSCKRRCDDDDINRYRDRNEKSRSEKERSSKSSK
eukprot:TCONS_00010540-protein